MPQAATFALPLCNDDDDMSSCGQNARFTGTQTGGRCMEGKFAWIPVTITVTGTRQECEHRHPSCSFAELLVVFGHHDAERRNVRVSPPQQASREVL